MAGNTEDLRVVLIGKTGAGKSAVGNTLLGRKAFQSVTSCSSVTKVTGIETAKRFGRIIQVIDTPGFFDTNTRQEDILDEIRKAMTLSMPGPHAFMLVVKPERFTHEERKVFSLVQEVFGEGVISRLFVVFSRRDDLEADGMDIKEYIESSPMSLKNIIGKVDDRYFAINNRADVDEKNYQANDLLTRVDNLIECYGGTHYDLSMKTPHREQRRGKQARHWNKSGSDASNLSRHFRELAGSGQASHFRLYD